MRELEETVRLASSLHAQLKRSVAYFGSPRPQKVGRSGLLGEEPRTAFCLFSLLTQLLSRTVIFCERCDVFLDFRMRKLGWTGLNSGGVRLVPCDVFSFDL